MANPEHIEILKQGSEHWNKWRKNHPEIRPDLNTTNFIHNNNDNFNFLEFDLNSADLPVVNFSNFDLSNFDLSNSDLIGVNLYNANLSNANLSNANLSEANLNNVKLNGANLNAAYLNHTNLNETDLSEANLDETDFECANICAAKLKYARNLNKANFTETSFNRIDLSEADLVGAHLDLARFHTVDLSRANLSNANLAGTTLSGIKLASANLSNTYLGGADLSDANLTDADLSAATLLRANLSATNFTNTNLTNTNLIGATLFKTNFRRATLTNCRIYGISAWDVQLEGAIQKHLIITDEHQPIITVDNLKIAHFISLLVSTPDISEMLNPLTTRTILIIGSFAQERKTVLSIFREILHKYNYQSLLLDFSSSFPQTSPETISRLASLSHFIIADFTDLSDLPETITKLASTLTVPVQPLFEITHGKDFNLPLGAASSSVILPIYQYPDIANLRNHFAEKVIVQAEHKVRELALGKV